MKMALSCKLLVMTAQYQIANSSIALIQLKEEQFMFIIMNGVLIRLDVMQKSIIVSLLITMHPMVVQYIGMEIKDISPTAHLTAIMHIGVVLFSYQALRIL